MVMDVFIREQLVLNVNTSLDDVVPHCNKLIAWLMEYQDELQTQSQLQLTQPVVECLIKAHLYLFECQDRFGKPLIDRCDARQRFWINCSNLEDRPKRIRELCSSILNTHNGQEHAASLYWMNKCLVDVQAGWSVIRDLNWRELRENETNLIPSVNVNQHLRHMRCLVRRICRLATIQEIEIALQRSLGLIKFDVWLHLFRETRESPIQSQCYILRHMICDWLQQGDDGKACSCSSFIHKLYEFVMIPTNEMRFWHCLENRRLATSLLSYLAGYWKRHLPYLDMDKMQLSANIITIIYQPLEEYLYLTHLMFASKSPCRHLFDTQLRSTLTSGEVLQLQELLNKVAFVYN